MTACYEPETLDLHSLEDKWRCLDPMFSLTCGYQKKINNIRARLADTPEFRTMKTSGFGFLITHCLRMKLRQEALNINYRRK